MMAPPEYYVFTGRTGEVIPRHVTHVLIAKALKFVRASAFRNHPNIQELVCHNGVEKIEQSACRGCTSLRRVIMRGVKVVEKWAFYECTALTYIECGKLEIIGQWAFSECESLSSIDLPFIKIFDQYAFTNCTNLTNAKFGKDLESLGCSAFCDCTSLERIALPLKDDMINHGDSFRACVKLNHIDLIGGVHETVAALQMEEWKNDMNEELDSINQILPNTPSGCVYYSVGKKAGAIRTWITKVLHKYNIYKAKHRRYVNEAAAILQPALPRDVILKNVLPFLELPSYTFDGEE